LPKTGRHQNGLINCKHTGRILRIKPKLPWQHNEKCHTYNAHHILADYDAVYNASEPVPVAHKMRIRYTVYNTEGKCQDQVPGDSKTESHCKFINSSQTSSYELDVAQYTDYFRGES
jgi:hypothetical protein